MPVFGNTCAPKEVDALIARLERDDIVTIDGKKIAYAIPQKAK